MSSEINGDVRFDHAAANTAMRALREALCETERLLATRRRRRGDLNHYWEGPAREWHEDRSSAFEVVASVVQSELEATLRALVSKQGEASAEQQRRVAVRVERARLEREVQATRERAEEARRAAQATADTPKPALPATQAP